MLVGSYFLFVAKIERMVDQSTFLVDILEAFPFVLQKNDTTRASFVRYHCYCLSPIGAIEVKKPIKQV